MKYSLTGLGVIVAFFGVLFALQGFGVLGGSGGMNNTTTWSILGPIIAIIGLAMIGLGQRQRGDS